MMNRPSAECLPGQKRSRGRLLRAVDAIVVLAGIGVGLIIFMPWESLEFAEFEILAATESLLLGLSFTGVWFAFPSRVASRRLGVWRWLWLASALGILLMLPAAVAGKFFLPAPPGMGDGRQAAIACLGMSYPLFHLWFCVAAAIAGQLGLRKRRDPLPAMERVGLLLALAWAALGAWILGTG